jgi:putative Mg2+ transporter-C (MgtC) family protein
MTPSPDLLLFVRHLATSAALGAVIGLERQWHQGMAGLRTNALVATGAAAFTSLPGILGEDGIGPAHMATYLITGIGFLGAGVIMREGANVRGLNTAATLWVTASVGAFAGSGLSAYAIVVAAAILSVNLLMRPFVMLVNRASIRLGTAPPNSYTVEIVCDVGDQKELRTRLIDGLAHDRISLRGLETREVGVGENRVTLSATVAARGDGEERIERLVSHLATDPMVSAASWQRSDKAENDPKLHPGS